MFTSYMTLTPDTEYMTLTLDSILTSDYWHWDYDTELIIIPNVIRQTNIHELLNSGQGYFHTPDSWYTLNTGPLNFLIQYFWILNIVLSNPEHEYSDTTITDSCMWSKVPHEDKYTSHTRSGCLESVGVPLESTRSGEWSKVHMELSTHRIRGGGASKVRGGVLSGTQMVYGAKYIRR